MLKPLSAHVMNHANGKHITVTLDAADPQRNALLQAAATSLRDAGREADAAKLESLIDRVIVSRGVGPEIRTADILRGSFEAGTISSHGTVTTSVPAITSETLVPKQHAEAQAPRSHLSQYNKASAEPVVVEPTTEAE